ncbi:MAG: DNA polymerase/3'-5' exonuclease PolX [Planctomycetes bacterium]|nr:DNA polymerase/3'-5' exonuclease PolX [Planctomycetota bacterium]MBI3835190.1 DNA polymerase/3'-5' exonuclease PolX [Planctomycetota bacterium]
MTNEAIIEMLEKLADLMELDGVEAFRVNSYRRAVRSIRDFKDDLTVLANQNRLTEIPGVGKGIAGRIAELVSTGRLAELETLEQKVPTWLPTLLAMPGLGPKKAALIHEKLGVTDLAGLKTAIESGKLAEIPGLGDATAKKIAEGIQFIESGGGRVPLGIALPLAEALAERIRYLSGVRRVEIAGSLRRGKETVADIDILCETDQGEKAIKEFTSLSDVRRVLAAGETKGSVTIKLPEGGEIQVDLRAIPTESFGAGLMSFTGSKEHNIRLRERAIACKWSLNEYGLFEGTNRLVGESEEAIYAKLGLPFVPPELREDRGELDRLPADLVSLDDIRGDLHMHTVASDGRNSIEEMAAAAQMRGYEFIAICDHSKSSTIANGLSIERMEQHIEGIRRVARAKPGIHILLGCECDILLDGQLDYPDEILAKCDWVVASAHARATGPAAKLNPTERTLAAIENRYVCAIGHPTGRLINRRPPMEIDMPRVVAAAAKNGTCLEINASWQRLDLKDEHAQMALAAGGTLTINTDAHSTDQLDQMRLGIVTARRAGATKQSIANCVNYNELRKLIARKRGA